MAKKEKEYKCYKCGIILKDYKPIRLVKQVYNTGIGYKQYLIIKHFDLCKKCYKIFIKWLEKEK